MSLNISTTEHDEQVAFFEEVALAHRNLWKNKLIYAIPNGGYRNKITAIQLKAEGVVAGIPDIFCAVAKSGYHGLYIERKSAKAGSCQSYSVTLSATLPIAGTLARLPKVAMKQCWRLKLT